MKKTVITIIEVLFLLAVAFLIGRERGRSTSISSIKEKTDTLYVRDTICVKEPVFIEHRVVDYISVPVIDTLRLRDTVWLQLPREQREYADTSYHAWVSGYLPELDSIRIYRSTAYVTKQIITEVEVMKRWSIGIQAGYGVALSGGSLRTAPYVGVGVSYNLFSW